MLSLPGWLTGAATSPHNCSAWRHLNCCLNSKNGDEDKAKPKGANTGREKVTGSHPLDCLNVMMV